MQYIGGKQKSGGAQISVVINRIIRKRKLETYSEPFCGGLSVTQRIVASVRHASDACEALICMYKALQSGTWTPPLDLTREEWVRLRDTNDPRDPLTAFAGFGCSNRGAWFRGYAARYKFTGGKYVEAALAAASSLKTKMRKCNDVRFAYGDYREQVLGDVVYCDPPYAGTLGYPAVPGEWDPLAFWAWARATSDDRLLCVSEQHAPDDFVALLSFSIQSKIAMATGARRDEYLFVPRHQLDAWASVAG